MVCNNHELESNLKILSKNYEILFNGKKTFAINTLSFVG